MIRHRSDCCRDQYLAVNRTRLKKALKYALIIVGSVVGALLLFILVVVVPLDRTQSKEKPIYRLMMNRIDSVKSIARTPASHGFQIGFATVNLTPSHAIATAGYGNRRGKTFTSVHDSIYVRAMVIDNGTSVVAIVTADLLIIPPTVTAVLEKELPEIDFSLNNTFLGATHTHNSIGNWGQGATEFIYGDYDDSIVHFIADKIKLCITKAKGDLKNAKMKIGTVPLGSAVQNRLDKKSTVDSLIRVIEIHRSDSSTGILLSYTAHATCLFSRNLELSRDYPGVLVDDLEKKGYSFAMFMAGAVGSHGCHPPEFGWPCLTWMSDQIVKKVLSQKQSFHTVQDSTVSMVRVPLALPDAQVKISKDWCVRPWLFESLFGDYQPYITALRIGNIVFLGTPCDYSGELSAPVDQMGQRHNLHPVITSFNGHYIGYITRDDHFDLDHYETRLMNWYGPGNGQYLADCLTRLTEAVAD